LATITSRRPQGLSRVTGGEPRGPWSRRPGRAGTICSGRRRPGLLPGRGNRSRPDWPVRRKGARRHPPRRKDTNNVRCLRTPRPWGSRASTLGGCRGGYHVQVPVPRRRRASLAANTSASQGGGLLQ